MSNTVIRVENLGKKYIIGHQKQERYTTLRDVLTNGAVFLKSKVFKPFAKRLTDPTVEEFWALKDVSFEIKQGSCVGIIGRNGAGKSTLLKVLSRITEPTTGCISTKGRVASLLEVGTGFHPELTGRENIYLNGAILGMCKAEIKKKFDEIVAFAEVEKFLDTPVKRYSSGMYVRLAFAVAAHLEPEILIIDEVLAVGDNHFQKKCLGKMEGVAKEGRTVLFVSHNMAAVEKLCGRGIVLHQGKVQYVGSHTEAITQYLTKLSEHTISLQERINREGSGGVRVVGIEFKDANGNVIDTAVSGQDIDIYLYFKAIPDSSNYPINVGITFKTQLDVPVFLQSSILKQVVFKDLPELGAFTCCLKRLPLPPSTYRVGYALIVDVDGKCLDSISEAAELTVIQGDFFGSGMVPPISHGVCLVDAEWHLVQQEVKEKQVY